MTFRDLRVRQGFPQIADLAAESGLFSTTIKHLEKGRVQSPRFSTVQALAVAMGTSPLIVARAIEESWRDARDGKAVA